MDIPGLQVGMRIEAVRKLLDGWSDHPVMMVGPSDNLYHLWDFTPPQATDDQRPTRLTFHEDMLVLWGEPAPERGCPPTHGRAVCARWGIAQASAVSQAG